MENSEKVEFIKKELTVLIKKIAPDVKKLEYIYSRPSCEEYCKIYFVGGGITKVCITADSLSAIVVDVLRGCV